MLLVDNLDSQMWEGFASTLRKGGCLRWLLPPDCTDMVQPVDWAIGRMVRREVGRQQDAWLMGDGNLERWEGKMTASERRVLMT